MKDCPKASIFFTRQREALQMQFAKRRQKMSDVQDRVVSIEEAKADFINNDLYKFAEGFRSGFCAGCDKTDECDCWK